jgi:RNA polymerase sigma-70 factor (ECF subfamily)
MSAIGPAQLGRLYDEHARSMLLFARQWCDGPGAEDAVQEAFVSLARQRRSPEQVVPWLYRVVRNASISAVRGAVRRRRREGAVSRGEQWFEPSHDRVDASDASRLLRELTPDCREVVVARLWGGLTFDEIAQLQGCSLATAHRRYHEALAHLHERLEPACPAPVPNSRRI